jgi:flagellar motor switch protein FliN/FliY
LDLGSHPKFQLFFLRSEQMPETQEQLNTVNPTATALAGQAQDTSSSASTSPTPLSIPDLTKLAADQLGKKGNAIDLLKDVELNVKIELGRAKMYVEDVLKLSEGAIVELDKLAGDPVDVFVNERLVARGEVLVLNENFCVRINQIMSNIV